MYSEADLYESNLSNLRNTDYMLIGGLIVFLYKFSLSLKKKQTIKMKQKGNIKNFL